MPSPPPLPRLLLAVPTARRKLTCTELRGHVNTRAYRYPFSLLVPATAKDIDPNF